MDANTTVLLGRTPVEVSGVVSIERKVETEAIEVGYEWLEPPPPREATIVTASYANIYIGGRLYATTTRYTLKKDLETGHMTLRLYKNKTRVH